MKKNSSLITSTIIIVLVGSSCVPVYEPTIVPIERQKENIYYTAKTPDVPFLMEKNDYTFSFLFSGGDKHSGVDLKGSFSPINHFGVMVNYSGYAGVSSGTHFLGGDLGAGYYTPISPLSNFETYGGVGINKSVNQHFTGGSTFRQTNLFLQPAFTFRDKSNSIQFGLVSKFNLVNYNLVDTLFNTDREPYSTSQVNLLVSKPNQLFWEPGLVFRAGGKSLMFQFGFSIVNNLTTSDLNYSRTHFSLGLHFRFPIKEKYIIRNKKIS